ncbi:MAG: SpoIVB peptidase S55 domain-containing protein [Armatimonadota bacterium]
MAYWRYLLLFAVTAVFICIQSAQTAASSLTNKQLDPADLKNIMLLKDVKPGMKGYGKTVFKGTKVETFSVEVLGILKKANIGTDQILVKMVGGPMTDRGANLIRGMSGSPVYINGKLIGAFAYGQAFVKEPMGMVTPIEYMLDAWNPKLPSKPSSFYSFSTSDQEGQVALSDKSYGKVVIDNGSQNADQFDDGTMVFQPLGMPLMVSGMSSRVISRLQERLKPLNLYPVSGPGFAEDKADLHIDIQAGSAVAVSFVTGDMDVSGVGTVTYRRGNRILAFGHPMFSNSSMNGIGALDAPFSTAYVYDVLPNVQISSKIAAPVKQIGRVFQDRPWAIAAEIGKQPAMIPAVIHVNDKSLNRNKNFRVNVINHPLLTADFIVSAAAEAVYELRGTPTDAVAKVRFEVTADEVGVIKRENVFFDPVSVDAAAVSELEQVLGMLQSNPFYPVEAKKVEVWIDITSDHNTAKLEKVFLKESKYEPGDTVEIGAVLKPFKGECITKYLNLKLPKNMPGGQIAVQIGGGMSRQSSGLPEGLVMLISRPSGPSSSPVNENLQQMMKKFLEREKNNELVARITLPTAVPTIAGEKLSGLPPTIAESMKSAKATQFGTDRDEIKEVVPTDWIISGSQRVNITVRKPEKSEKKSAAPRTPSQAPASSPNAADDSEDEDSDDSATVTGIQDVVPAASLPDKINASAEPTKPAAVDSKPNKVKDDESAKSGDSAGKSEPAKDEASAASEKPLIRAFTTWKQTSRIDFLTGTMEGLSASTGDLLTIAGSVQPLWTSDDTYAWSIIPDGNGNLLAGTGNKGIIYRIDAQGKASVFYDSPELQVHSLVMDTAGNVYAGTSPNGMIYKIDPSGKASVFYDAVEKYITAMAFDGSGNLFAAVGDGCRVYKISLDGKSSVALDSSESHALSLAVDKSNNVYVGTGQNGIIYKIADNSSATVLYDAAEEVVTSLAVNKDGILYAGTGAKGMIYKLAPNASPKVIYDKAGQTITGMCADADGTIYAVNASGVYRIVADDKVCMLDNKHDIQFLSVTASGGRVYTGTGNVGSIYFADMAAQTGKYESPVHDCGSVSNWGVLSWTADTPKASTIQLRTRSGNVAEPDATWSQWSDAHKETGSIISSPSARYIQYQVEMKSDGPDASPVLKDLSIVYLTKNQAPTITMTSPNGPEKWSKKKVIKWKGTDPDKDTLTYELFISGDKGQTWTPLSNGVKPVDEKKPADVKPQGKNAVDIPNEAVLVRTTDPDQAMAQLSDELAKHPEIPQDMKDKILAEAPGMIQEMITKANKSRSTVKAERAIQEAPGKSVSNSTKETSFDLDTAKHTDGSYLIKVVCSDKLSNPVDPLSAEAISDTVAIINKAPKLFVFKKSMTVQADKSVKIDGAAYQDLAAVTGIQYKVDSGDWTAAVPSDGIYDTVFEAFSIVTQPLDTGDHAIEIKAIDQAGGSATSKIPVKVE